MAGLQQSLVGRLNWFSSALELFTTLISLFQATNTLLPALLLLCFLPLFYTKVRLYRHRPQGNKNKFSSCCETTTLSAAKSLQSCPTLCNPIDGSPPGSPVPGILQARTLEWGAISFFNAWKWKAKGKSLGRVWLFATPWTAAYQASPSMGFSRQEYWSGVPSPSPTI